MKYKFGALLCAMALIFCLAACREKTNVTGQNAIEETQTEGQAGIGESSITETGETESTEPEATKPGEDLEETKEGSTGIELGVTPRPTIPGVQGEPGSDEEKPEQGEDTATTLPRETSPAEENQLPTSPVSVGVRPRPTE